MTLPSADSKLDIRTLERALRDGTLTKKDLEKHLKSLPDEQSKSEEIHPAEAAQKISRKISKESESTEEPTFSV